MVKVSEPDPDYRLTTKTRQKIEDKVPSRGEVRPDSVIPDQQRNLAERGRAK